VRTLWLAPALALGLLGGAPAAAEEPPGDPGLANIGKELARKRAAIDGLAGELELGKAEMRDRLRALGLQRADLERQVKALEVERAEVRRGLERREQEAARREAARARLRPLVLEQVEAVRAVVLAGIPFKTEERAAELDRLADALRRGDASPDDALAKLWSAVEDELRLARENGLHRQPIALGGERVLAEVAKLGTALLYFRALDGRVGFAARGADGAWTYRVADDPADAARIRALFDALRKHIREGYFELPNPAATKGR
jgi:hypothetical protein